MPLTPFGSLLATLRRATNAKGPAPVCVWQPASGSRMGRATLECARVVTRAHKHTLSQIHRHCTAFRCRRSTDLELLLTLSGRLSKRAASCLAWRARSVRFAAGEPDQSGTSWRPPVRTGSRSGASANNNNNNNKHTASQREESMSTADWNGSDNNETVELFSRPASSRCLGVCVSALEFKQSGLLGWRLESVWPTFVWVPLSWR